MEVKKVMITYPNGATMKMPMEMWKDLLRKKEPDPNLCQTWSRVRPSILTKLARYGWDGQNLFRNDREQILVVNDYTATVFPNLDAVNQFFESQAY